MNILKLLTDVTQSGTRTKDAVRSNHHLPYTRTRRYLGDVGKNLVAGATVVCAAALAITALVELYSKPLPEVKNQIGVRKRR